LTRELEEKGSFIGTDFSGREKRHYDEENFTKAHEYSREIRSASAKLIRDFGDEDMLLLNKRTLLFDAPHNFDCAFRYAEWNRPVSKRFYEPRRKQLKRAADAMQRLEERKIHRLLLMMPPGTGKSTLAIGFMVWSGMRNYDLSILGVSHNNAFLRGVYDEMLRFLDPNGEYLWSEIFPDVFISNTLAKDMRIDLVTQKRFQTFELSSVGSGNAGKVRATNLLYCDDLVDGLESAMSIDRMDKLWGLYNTDARQRMLGDCGELIIQTPWSLHDPIDRLESMFENDPDTEVIKFPALDENDESNFDYPYGLGYTTKQFHDQREIMDDVSWRALYMCQPIEREGQLYDPESLKRYYELPDKEPDVIFAVCDTKEQGPDYCAMPIVYKYGDEYYIDKFICDNGNPDIIEERITQTLVERGVKLARFESNRGGTLFATDVQKKVKAKGGITKITTKWNQTNKDTRIITRAGWVKEHCVFKDESIYDKEYRTAMDMLCQYNMAGKNKHDDVPDVMADLADYVENMGVASVSVAKRFF
jgi:predicted phage terminase large subunit-like protein